MTVPQLILHHYDFSNYAEKVRLVLGYKSLTWRSVTIPSVAPKPDLTPLTGGYRRTPVLQIGADIYCDTGLIVRELERRQPLPSLFPTDCQAHATAIAYWAENQLFRPISLYVSGSSPDFFPLSLQADRARYESDRAKDSIDAVMKGNNLDAILFPGASGAGIAAKPGCPAVIVPSPWCRTPVADRLSPCHLITRHRIGRRIQCSRQLVCAVIDNSDTTVRHWSSEGRGIRAQSPETGAQPEAHVTICGRQGKRKPRPPSLRRRIYNPERPQKGDRPRPPG